jgi:HD-GYP domain-containing protein (c-di-GMP phosphodiesterase class II)
MKSLESLSGHIVLGRPLPWDIYDSRSQPLLRKGFVINDPRQLQALLSRGVYVDYDEFERARTEQAAVPQAPAQTDPFWHWDSLYKRLDLSLREHVTDPNFVHVISGIASEMDSVTTRDPDAGIFAMVRLDTTRYPIAHSMQTALVAALIARGMNLTDDQRLLTLRASLTMNIAMIELQKQLHKQTTPLTDAQRTEIRTHPIRGWQRLELFGVKDHDWLRIVAEHHETPDGKGYPAGHTELTQISTIIRHADMYCAMVTGRAYRKALPPNRVARELFLASSGENASEVPAMIIKQLGIFPPGNFVKLANGETGIVVGRGATPKAPKVCGLQDKRGVKYSRPTHRDTAEAEFAVLDAIPPDGLMFQIDPVQLFGYQS